MFRQPGRWKERIEGIAKIFREKGATAPEKAMTAQELGLPPRFEDAMKRRLGQTRIFVQVGDKYYLDEVRLREVEQGWTGAAHGGTAGLRRNMFTLRMIRLILGVLTISLVLINLLYGRKTDLWIAIAALLVIWISVSVFQIYYLSRARRLRASPAIREHLTT